MDKCSSNLLSRKFIKFQGVSQLALCEEYADVIENFKIRDDDVWIIGFPKTGTTWIREMVWCIGNDLDFEGAKASLEKRCPFLEFEGWYHWDNILKKHPELNLPEYITQSINFTDELPSPRFIKTHLPFHLLPRDLRERKTQAKIVYCTRNPKDVVISSFHFRKNMTDYEETFEEFCMMFLKHEVAYCPFWDHVLGYLNAKNQFEDKIMILRFSDMKANIRQVIRELLKFLGKSPLSSDDLEKLLDHLSFEKMKNNPAVNWKDWLEYCNVWHNHKRKGEFMRSGQVGEWKSTLPQELAEEFDQRTSSVLKSTDFTF